MPEQTLYSGGNSKSIKGGYKNKEEALRTIASLKHYPMVQQRRAVDALYRRAKYHPYQTKAMREAMKIFLAWMKKYDLVRKSTKSRRRRTKRRTKRRTTTKRRTRKRRTRSSSKRRRTTRRRHR